MANNKFEETMELLSLCCGAEEHEYAEGFCSACREASQFEEVITIIG
tara:strand:- start:964 stop:1104 length:141 start_codon:yes stop_codon:yes gene_type:complete